MPSWLLPALLTGGFTVLLGGLAVIWAELKASETRQQDALKAFESRQQDTLKAFEARQQDAFKAMEARQQDALTAREARQREDTRELHSKVDRLIEGLLAPKAP